MVTPDGTPMRVGGWEGESLLQCLERHNVPGIYAECGGGDDELRPFEHPVDYYTFPPTCGQCSVFIPDPWSDKVTI